MDLREEGEVVRSSHALDFLADVWTEEGRRDDADRALRLLGNRYDRVRRGYWEWKRKQLGRVSVTEKAVETVEKGVEELSIGA